MRTWPLATMAALAVFGCNDGPSERAADAGGGGGAVDAGPSPDAGPFVPGLGATPEPDGAAIHFRIASTRATRVELWIYAEPLGAEERLRVTLAPEGDVFAARVEQAALVAAGVTGTVYYGYRVWGPNWPYDPAWTPGSTLGHLADVDAAGNRMNPNKLLIDPYARELSHDPTGPGHTDAGIFRVGDAGRARDSGPLGPKSIVIAREAPGVGPRPTRPFRDEVIYEVHLRGLTQNELALGDCRGTYAGAAAKAGELAALGVTAVEFLPVHETWNDANDLAPTDASGDNYWGYSTLSFFAPDRRYACDRSPGGPTREFRAMARAFHEAGLKVYLDVVYNHTSEGGGGSIHSLRGLDNAAYYQVGADPTRFHDNTGIGANTNVTHPLVRDLVLDSLRYWADDLGVDGFRFDLASVLGNACASGTSCFDYAGDTPDGILVRAARELPARPAAGGAGVDLIAEPWGIGAGTYQLGHFPAGWAEWNGEYRDLVRRDQNQLGVAAVTLGWLANRVAGSPDHFEDDGRRPWHSVNFLVSHDGFTLRDLYSCSGKRNEQPWPYGPSSGGENNNLSWDHGGDAAAQRQAARTGLALLMLSAGVPMIVGGDEMFRSQGCNNNPYNLDSPKIWLEWQNRVTYAAFATFAARLIAFRHAHPALRPADWWSGDDVTWYGENGQPTGGAPMDDPNRHFLGWRLAAPGGSAERSLFVAYNGAGAPLRVTLPARAEGTRWYRVADTGAWMEGAQNFHAPGDEYQMMGGAYDLGGRTLALFVER